jgi:hypothetical protein
MRTAGASFAAKRSERPYFVGITIAIVAVVFAGFSRSFYLHSLFGVPSPTTFVTFHGSLMSGWILIVFVQAMLVATHRVLWHRRLGIFGACYAALIVPVGCMTTLAAAAREVRAQSADVASQLDVLALELTQMLLFALLVGGAVWLRKRLDWHKRLMLLATLCILPNAIVRLALATPYDFLQRNITLVSIWALLLVAVVAIDSYRRRRLHPAFGLLGTMTVGSMYAAYFVGLTQPWIRIATQWVS